MMGRRHRAGLFRTANRIIRRRAATSGSYTLVDTVGQAFAGQTSTGGAYNFQSGFWAGAAASSNTRFDFDGDGKADVSVL